MADSNPDQTGPEHLLQRWHRTARQLQVGHHLCSTDRDRIGRILGVATVAITAVVSSGVFASLGREPDSRFTGAIGAISLLAVLTASISSYLKFPELAARHKASAGQYGEIRRRIEVLAAKRNELSREEFLREVEHVRCQWDDIEKHEHPLPRRYFDRAQAQSRPDEGLALG